MYGAMLGDIIGSRFEFDMGNKSKEFEPMKCNGLIIICSPGNKDTRTL